MENWSATFVEYRGWIRTSQPSCNNFCLVIKETCNLTLSWWKIMCFLLTNSGHFLSSAAFIWPNWEQYLLEWIVWFSGKSSYNRGLPISPYTQHHLLWMKTVLWCSWWWFISLASRSLLFHIIVQYPLFTAHHNLFEKRNVFRESHLEIWPRRFFCLNETL